MKRYAALLAILAIVVPALAFAGANQGAALLVNTGSATKTTPATCTALGGKLCAQLQPNFNTQLAPLLSWIAVYVGRQPALTSVTGVDFGVQYDMNALYNTLWTNCGSLEVQQAGWPGSGTGNTVVWSSAQAGETVLVGYFQVAKYAGYPSYDFQAGAHPLYGVARILDAASNFDPLRYPAIANLAGQGGFNPECLYVGVKQTTWGNIKNMYQN